MNNVDLSLPQRNRRYCSSCKPGIFRLFLISCLFAVGSGHTQAAEPPATAPQDELEPEVTITQQEGEMIEEYRINNQLYMIKVIPRKGYAYYLVDTDGDGRLDTRRNDLVEDVLIPQWTLLRF